MGWFSEALSSPPRATVRHQESTPEASRGSSIAFRGQSIPGQSGGLRQSIAHVFHKRGPSEFGYCTVREGTFRAVRRSMRWAVLARLPRSCPFGHRRQDRTLGCYRGLVIGMVGLSADPAPVRSLFALAILRRGTTVGTHPGDAGHEG